ncbi:MAG: efflux RND transporter periplasmic adaptor subunit [Chloroflexi bacterium]|nr:efflux RND transporter periplasmic adaptor subunit [Chloroflexota bacterium]
MNANSDSSPATKDRAINSARSLSERPQTTGLPPGQSGGEQETEGKNRPRLRRILVPIVLVLVVIGAAISYHFWYDDAFFVSTENARVAGALVQIGALNAGRVDSVTVDVGNRVERDQVVATLTLPSVVSVAQGNSKIGFDNTSDLRVEVRSPINGVVVARQGNVGDAVAPGQSILIVTDPSSQWVVANIEETKIGRIKRGQPVQVHVDALDRTFSGHVDTITPATAATFSLLPQQNGSGNFTKVTQLVPVKILVDTQGQTLPLGGSVEVRIRVSEQEGWLSWLR